MSTLWPLHYRFTELTDSGLVPLGVYSFPVTPVLSQFITIVVKDQPVSYNIIRLTQGDAPRGQPSEITVCRIPTISSEDALKNEDAVIAKLITPPV